MATQRYNAGIQRAKGLLEIAAGLYDSSLSYQTKRAAEGMLQTDTDLWPRAQAFSRHEEIRNPAGGIDFLHDRQLSRDHRGRRRKILAGVGEPIGIIDHGLSRHRPLPQTAAAQDRRCFSLLRHHGFCRSCIDGNHFTVTDRQRTHSAAHVHRRDTQKSANRKCDDVHGLGGFGRGGFSLGELRRWGAKLHSAPR